MFIQVILLYLQICQFNVKQEEYIIFMMNKKNFISIRNKSLQEDATKIVSQLLSVTIYRYIIFLSFIF